MASRTPKKKTASSKAEARRPKIVARRCSGTEDLEALQRLRGRFERDAQRWQTGARETGDLVAAMGYWMGYPFLLEMIGHEWREEPGRTSAYYALNHVHEQATHVLMEEAEKLGLDCHPLYEAAQVCRELFADDPGKYYIGPTDYWPQCLGATRYALPAGMQEAIRAGEATFVRLGVRADIVDKGTKASLTSAIGSSIRASFVIEGPEDGRPFYKPSYFKKYNIGDEQLRKKATSGERHVPGKVRRINKQTHKGKRAVYWYSEPDARECWPHMFLDVKKPSSRS